MSVSQDELANDDLKCRRFYIFDSRDCIKNLCRIGEVLTCCRAIYGFDPRCCAVRSSLKSSILFSKNDSYNFYLTMGIADGGATYYPETFFYRYDDAYTRNQNIVRVVDIRTI